MDEQALRSLIREAVERHLGPRAPSASRALITGQARHPSHDRFNVLSGGDIEGPCLIEPAVSCNHCGYCLSHGH